MKIVIMVHALTGGGAERVAASWANGLVRSCHEVIVLTDTVGQTYELDPHVRVVERQLICGHSMTLGAKLMRKLMSPVADALQLWRLLNRNHPDAVVDVLYLSAYPLLFARLLYQIIRRRRIPIIMTDHNVYERPKGHGFSWRQWRNKFIDNRFFDCVTVLTHRDKEILSHRGIKNVEVLHNPLFLKPVDHIPPKEKIVLSVGRIDQWYVKGFDLLMLAWKQIAKKYPDWRLRLVGAGPPETINWLKGLARVAASSIEFVGYTSDIVEHYRQAAIYVMPSRYEGWGLVAVEAMSQGCATIACDYHGRQAEFITNGKNGLLCEPDNVIQLSSQISNLILAENQRHSLQFEAIKSVSFFNEDKVTTDLFRILNNNG